MYRRLLNLSLIALTLSLIPLSGWTLQSPLNSLDKWLDQQAPDSSRLTALYNFLENENRPIPSDSALHLVDDGLALAIAGNYKELETRFFLIKGELLIAQSKFDLAQEEFLKALELATSINDLDLMADSHFLLGEVYLDKTDYLNANEHYNRALSYYQENENELGQINALNGVAIIYLDIEEYELAQSFLEEQLNDNANSLSPKTKAQLLNNLGTVKRKMGNNEEALELYTESLNIALDQNLEETEAELSSNIALARIGLNDTTQLRSLLNNSLEINSAHQNKKRMAQNMVLISQYVFDIGADSAIELNRSALSISQEIGTLDEGRMASEQLYHIYKSLGDSENALIASDMNALYKDSIDLESAKYEIIKANFAQELDERENELKRNTLLLSATLAIILGLSVFLYYRQQLINTKRKSDLIREIDELRDKMLSNKIAIGDEIKTEILSRDKIVSAIDGKINDTDWSILNLLVADPLIVNKEIAESVNLSVEGTSSSLRKMYNLFELQDEKNKKVALVRKAISICS